MRIPAYFLQSLESIYHFRMRVSTDLQPIFKRPELNKTLRLSHFKAEPTGTHPAGQSVELTVPMTERFPTDHQRSQKSVLEQGAQR